MGRYDQYTPRMIVDSHCHLDRLKLKPEETLDDAVNTAMDRGVSHMLCVCISAENKAQVLEIADRYDSIFASVGVHPSDVPSEAAEPVVSVDALCEWSQAPKVVALGETGLDYYYGKEQREIQLASFTNHLQAAKKVSLPVIVHTRDAREDTISLIKAHGCSESAGVLHCFTESWDMAKAALDLNYYISISGIVTFKNAQALRDVVLKLPLERLLVETDSPYLAPIPYRGKPNQPKYVREVAEFVAELKGISLEALAEQTTENFFTLFKRAHR